MHVISRRGSASTTLRLRLVTSQGSPLVSYRPLGQQGPPPRARARAETRCKVTLNSCRHHKATTRTRGKNLRTYAPRRHELQCLAPVPQCGGLAHECATLTPSSRLGPAATTGTRRLLRGRARPPRHIERRRRPLTRASTPRRRRDGVTVTADPRGAAPRSLLASRETTRAIEWKARPE